MAPSPTHYSKLQVHTKSTDFVAATELVKVPLVAPAPNQIRVKQIYAGVNATDMNITAALYLTDGKLPYGIGLEALGLIDAIGSAIPSGTFKLGQPVLVFDGEKQSGFAEYSYKPPTALIPVPELKPEYLVSLVNGLTASIALDYPGHIKAGDKVLVTAAAGGTGQIVVQWAKAKGAHVVALTSSPTKAKYLKEVLGADEVINYREVDLDQVLTEKYPKGLDIVWETIGGETFKTLFSHLSTRGRLILIGSITTYKEVGLSAANLSIPNLNSTLLGDSRVIGGFLLPHFVSEVPEYLPQLIGGIAQGSLKAQVDLGEKSPGGKFSGVDQVARAQAWLHSGKSQGKVVVQLQQEP